MPYAISSMPMPHLSFNDSQWTYNLYYMGVTLVKWSVSRVKGFDYFYSYVIHASLNRYSPGERASVVRHPDHLRPEGDMQFPDKGTWSPGDRAPVKKHPDHLHPEGRMEFPEKPEYVLVIVTTLYHGRRLIDQG